MQLYVKAKCSGCDEVKTILTEAGYDYDICTDPPDFKITTYPILITDTGNVLEYTEIVEKYSEPILAKNDMRYSLYPIKYQDIFELYQNSKRSFWLPEEIDLSKDEADWNSLSDDERYFVSRILSFFAGSDGIVNENINCNFSNEIEIPEVRAFYAIQEAIETIHNETYNLILQKYIKDPEKCYELQRGVIDDITIKKKADFAQRYMNGNIPFRTRILAFACVEGIFFSGSFCAIFWLKKRNLLPGLSFSNELISRDEGMHTDHAVLLYRYIVNQHTQSEVFKIVETAVDIEDEFITASLPCELIGMNSKMMKEYIRFVADRLLQQLGYNKLWNAENPFDFMENISLEGKTNFFEKRVGEYAKSHGYQEPEFDLEADF